MRSWDRFLNTSLAGGIIALAAGGWVLRESADYRLGTLLRMGPGYFPTLLGILMTVFGVILVLHGLRRGIENILRPEYRAMLFVLGGLAAFAVILPGFGLALAIFAMVVVSSFASPSSRPLTTIGLAVGLVGFAWVVFVAMLSLPLRMFPA